MAVSEVRLVRWVMTSNRGKSGNGSKWGKTGNGGKSGNGNK